MTIEKYTVVGHTLLLLLLLATVLFVPMASSKITHQDVTEDGFNSTVLIDNAPENSLGTGVHISPNLILTAKHVLGQQREFDIFYNDSDQPVKGKLATFDDARDLALIVVQQPAKTFAELSCSTPKRGVKIRAIGHPFGYQWISRDGTVTNPNTLNNKRFTEPLDDHLYAVDMLIMPGMSGGALFDNAGKVVGVVVRTIKFPGFVIGGYPTHDLYMNIGLAVKPNEVCKLLAQR